MELHHEIVVDAPACAAWGVLGERFGEISEWSDLDRSSLEGELGVGAKRVCEGPAWGPFPATRATEELVAFDPDTMAFTYIGLDGLPWFMPKAQNSWSVVALDAQRCRVTTRAEVELVMWMRPLAPLFRLMIRRPMARLLDQLAAAIRTHAAAQPC